MVSARRRIYEFSNLNATQRSRQQALDFIIANWRSNEQFNDMVNETTEAIKSTIVNIDTEKVLINLFFKTHTSDPDPSIMVSIINRDVAKLKFIMDPVKSPVQITKDFSNEDIENAELMEKIDLQWLFYEYKGLLKTYVRKFKLQYATSDDVSFEGH
ncbi:hypothetical protein JCM33374_g6682 [Metschnikowia sp. JCM 33374]|nr:hypothetical protein JCM33374_g6682 [Metschnikowia sp. JCM 33374]